MVEDIPVLSAEYRLLRLANLTLTHLAARSLYDSLLIYSFASRLLLLKLNVLFYIRFP